MKKENNKIAVLDFGGQYCHLIANRIRRLGVYSEILPNNTKSQQLRAFKGIIVSGGPQNISEDDSLKCNSGIFKLGIPVLGICYGHQLISFLLGGKVARGKIKEYGKATVYIKQKRGIFYGLASRETVWMSHGDFVSKLPSGFEIIGSTVDCPTAAVADFERNIFGLQFHPEVTHTKEGMKILKNFVLNVCEALPSWNMQKFIQAETRKIKKQLQGKKVFLLVSGGVDSTVCLALLNKALGAARVYGLNIDNGLMRKNEQKDITAAFRKNKFTNFHGIDSSEEFLGALKNVYDPEKKREIIGRKFIAVQNQETKKLKLDPQKWILGQGTIYPDTIETGGTKHSAVIKTHHNRVAAVQKLIKQGKIIEPLKELYKDEVRMVGEMLGLPHNFVYRHPFPGPGLGIRCLCAEKAYFVKGLSEGRIGKIGKQYKLETKVLPIKSVGVQGDSRTYAYPCALAGKTNFQTLEKISTKLTNNVKKINRVIWLLTKADLSKLTVKKSYLTKQRLDLLRNADDLVNSYLRKNNLYESIWQFPVVLIPLFFQGGESIVLRPINSTEAMTASFTKLPLEHVKAITARLMKLKGIDAVFYDVTNKPPATIEWE